MGTKAACAGGVTTVFDMPLIGEPYTFTDASFQAKQKAAYDRLWADCGFIGAINSGSLTDSKALAASGIFALFADYGTAEYHGLNAITLDEFSTAQEMLSEFHIPLFISCQKCEDPIKLHSRSPFRDQPPENRFVVPPLLKTTETVAPAKEEQKVSHAVRSMDLPVYLPPVNPPLTLTSRVLFCAIHNNLKHKTIEPLQEK